MTTSPDLALALLEDIQRRGQVPDMITYSAAISAFEKGKQPDNALSPCGHAVNGLEPAMVTHCAAISACEKGKQPDKALELLQDMHWSGQEPTSGSVQVAAPAHLQLIPVRLSNANSVKAACQAFVGIIEACPEASQIRSSLCRSLFEHALCHGSGCERVQLPSSALAFHSSNRKWQPWSLDLTKFLYGVAAVVQQMLQLRTVARFGVCGQGSWPTPGNQSHLRLLMQKRYQMQR